MSRPIFRFADFQLDPAARELRRGGERVALPPKSLECLIYLVEQRERAVGRDELISAVWGRVDVSDALLAQTLLRARRAVGDTGNEQSSIRTVPRFGYQWVAATQVMQPADPAIATETPPAAPRPGRPRWLLPALLLAAAVLILLSLYLVRRQVITADAALLVVAPVVVDGDGGDSAWIRLGVMDYIAARLRRGGMTVLPSERVAALVAEHSGESQAQLQQRLRQASGAGLLLQPQASRQGDGSWQLRLQLLDGRSAQEFSARGASPLAAADQALAALLSRSAQPAAAPPLPPADAAAERVQRVDAAMLEGDLATARALIATAGEAVRSDPALRVREGQLAFRAGNLDAAQAVFAALQANLNQLPTDVQAQALMGLGAVAVRRADYAQGERRYAEALAVLGPDGSQELTGYGFTGRGVARAAQAQYGLAAGDLARARVALERAGDAVGVARVDTNLGLMELNSGKPALALHSFERAISVFQRFDVRDSLASGLLGKSRTQQQLADNAAALATARQAGALARELENPVLVRGVTQQLAEALLANGLLREAGAVLAGIVPAASGTPDALATTQARLALETGQPARALQVLAGAQLVEPDGRAEALLLRVRATLAADDAARQRSAVDAALAAAPADGPAALTLARALWRDAAGDHAAAQAGFAAALAQTGTRGNVDQSIEVLTHWIDSALRHDELERATELAGQIAPHAGHDFRAASAAARYYHAVGDAHLEAGVRSQQRALAGERSVATH
jgi:DNA-binding winged helix-turn-helix (wHTH) protein